MKRFIIEETEFTEYHLNMLTAQKMRNAVNDLNHDGPEPYGPMHVAIMDYFVINSTSAPRESNVVRVVHAMVNSSDHEYYSEADIKAGIKLLARPGKNKFLRIGRRSQAIHGITERLVELNYYHADS